MFAQELAYAREFADTWLSYGASVAGTLCSSSWAGGGPTSPAWQPGPPANTAIDRCASYVTILSVAKSRDPSLERGVSQW